MQKEVFGAGDTDVKRAQEHSYSTVSNIVLIVQDNSSWYQS